MKLDAAGALEFPCRYPVKAMTRASSEALEEVMTAISDHGAESDRDSVTVRTSRNGRYQSITVEIEARSRDQLEAVYAGLQRLEIVLMTL